ncbi:MAG: sirohydrochlorin cobaltochelatase [Lachnospiraceae bacterium]|nr:sirohydrochlorin cobaltochelatase [Lachnospiraceae bacterium]
MSKKAIVVVSFGTSYEEAEKAICNIEEKIREAFKDYDFFRAFTSGVIIRKLKKTKNIVIENPEELICRLEKEGYEEVICQPTHIINGDEYDKMCYMLARHEDSFQSLKVGKPLLTYLEDFKSCVPIILDMVEKLKDQEALLLMGHGSVHFANSAYCQMETIFRCEGHDNVYIGTVEGFPEIEYVMKQLKRDNIKKVYLAPFMIVAGDHARNDLAGEEEDSWKSILEKAGYETETILKGMGEIDEIANIFVEHAKEAEELEA